MLKTEKQEVQASTYLLQSWKSEPTKTSNSSLSSRAVLAGMIAMCFQVLSVVSGIQSILGAKVRQLKSLTSDQYQDIVINPVDSSERWPAPKGSQSAL